MSKIKHLNIITLGSSKVGKTSILRRYIDNEYKEDQIKKCQTLAVVKCFGNSNDICSFKILPTINDQPIFMSPKKTYYNVIAKGKEDLYTILVTEEEVNSIVIVLTSITGDAELQVEPCNDPNLPNNELTKSTFHSKISRLTLAVNKIA